VELIKKFIKNTYNPYVLGDLGSFAGAVEIPPGYDNPVLVSGTDGVGTKLLVAQFMDKHDTVGQDLVAMCVNDVLCHGAKPIYFLDYIACGKNKPKKIAQIVEGIANGCIIADCPRSAEKGEMPGIMQKTNTTGALRAHCHMKTLSPPRTSPAETCSSA
jgi:phosphoribosylformylglycinamidine cyclo-ligase